MLLYYKTYSFKPEEPISDSEKLIAKQARDYVLEQSFLSQTGRSFADFEVKYNKYGKPDIGNGLHFNISHTRGFVCCAISDKPVGVDAEYVRPVNIDIINKVCSIAEKQAVLSSDNAVNEFFRYWTLKESYIKMIGMGLSFPMNKISFSFDGNTVLSTAEDAQFDTICIEGYITALCCQNSDCKINAVRLA